MAAGARAAPGCQLFVHTGSLGGIWGHDTGPLASASCRCQRVDPGLAERVRIVIAGRPREDGLGLFSELGPGAVVDQVGPLPRPSAIALQRPADALLLVTSTNSGDRDRRSSTSTWRPAGPILALAGDNEAARSWPRRNRDRPFAPGRPAIRRRTC